MKEKKSYGPKGGALEPDAGGEYKPCQDYDPISGIYDPCGGALEPDTGGGFKPTRGWV